MSIFILQIKPKFNILKLKFVLMTIINDNTLQLVNVPSIFKQIYLLCETLQYFRFK